MIDNDFDGCEKIIEQASNGNFLFDFLYSEILVEVVVA